MIRRGMLVVVISTLAASCGTSLEHDEVPECSLRNASSVLLVAQAVPTAELIPCIGELQPGWRIGSLETKRGSARFILDSDTVGDGFLEVELAESCPDAAEETIHVVAGGDTRLSQDVQVTKPSELSIALIPVSGRQVVYSNSLGFELEAIDATVEIVPVGTAHHIRVAEALAMGRHAVVIDDFNTTEDTVFLYEPFTTKGRPVDRDDIVDMLADLQPEGGLRAYQGTWQFRFHGGCVTYRFDATGPETASLPEQVPVAVSFVARTTLDRFTRINVGLELDP